MVRDDINVIMTPEFVNRATFYWEKYVLESLVASHFNFTRLTELVDKSPIKCSSLIHWTKLSSQNSTLNNGS